MFTRTMVTLISDSLDPYRNLAIEDHLLDRAKELAPALFLWRGRCSVVIGKHQNPWRECRLAALHAAGGGLARRVSGGGAVYHDEGNLNYAFVCPRDSFDKDRQYAVVCRALSRLGINATRMGKSSIGVGPSKISGNAFCYRRQGVLHHGTLLVSARLERVGEFLKGRDALYKTHAVESEPAPVANLCESMPGLTVETVSDAIAAAFDEQYGCTVPRGEMEMLDMADLADREARMRTWDWCFGRTPTFTVPATVSFPWGTLGIRFRVEKGHATHADVTCDPLTSAAVTALGQALRGCRFDSREMAAAVRSCSLCPTRMANDLAEWLLTRPH
jgi:lipoate---protein ligase